MEGFDGDDGSGAAKRPGDDDTAEGSKRFKMDTVTVDLMVPGVTVATVIGKSGAHVKVIEQSSGTRISFAKNDETLVGENMRRVTITGATFESTNVALQQIAIHVYDHQMQAPTPAKGVQEGKYWIRILVPHIAVAALIGKKGAGIRQIIEGSGGSYVSFCKEPEMPAGSGERLVSFSGSLEQVIAAQELVLRTLATLPEADKLTGGRAHQGQSYQPNLSFPPSQHSQPSYLQSQPSYPQTDLYSGSAVQQSSMAGMMAKFATAYDPTHALSYDQNQYAPQAAYPPQTPYPTQLPQWTPPTDFAASQQPFSMLKPGSMGGSEEVHSLMYVPTQYVGTVIGAKGAAINEVIKLCEGKVYISVAPESENTEISLVGSGLMRPVKMNGPADYVLKAQQLIQQRLQQNAKTPLNWITALTDKPLS